MAKLSRPTINDVARLAGVSTTTVSHAFTGNGKVSPETRRRVREAAREVGYRPDLIGSGVRANRLGMIALVVRTLDEIQPEVRRGVDYFTRFAGAASVATLSEGYGLVLVADPVRGGASGAAMACDGFIVTEPHMEDPLIPILRTSGIPCVTVGEVPGRESGTARVEAVVDIETERLTKLALDHLAARGAQRIALVLGTESNEWNLHTTAVYRRWCSQHGVERLVAARREMMGVRGGRSAATHLFDRDDPPDGVYCLLASHSIGVLGHLARLGLRVPRDVRIVVGSDSVQARNATPALTAIDLEPEELARRAVTLLLSHMHGTHPPAYTPGVGRLLVRDST